MVADLEKRIEICVANITTLKVDAIVNAANSSLLGGGGVDGAIHRAAGPELALECRMLNGCKTGQAKITKAYKLPAQFVIHTVGPVWQDGNHDEPKLLRDCYQNSFLLAEKHQCQTIAFPAISTGIYRFPVLAAAKIAIETIGNLMQDHETPQKVIFCCFSNEVAQLYDQALEDYLKN